MSSIENKKLIDTAFKKIDELRDRVDKVERLAESNKRLASHIGKGYVELWGKFDQHKTEIKSIVNGIESKFDDFVTSNNQYLKVSMEKFLVEIESRVNKAILKIVLWIIGSFSTLVGLALIVKYVLEKLWSL